MSRPEIQDPAATCPDCRSMIAGWCPAHSHRLYENDAGRWRLVWVGPNSAEPPPKGANYVSESNPQPLPLTIPLDLVSSARRVHCRRYDECLNIAVRASWTSFHCLDCKIRDDLTTEEIREQAELIRASMVNREREAA